MFKSNKESRKESLRARWDCRTFTVCSTSVCVVHGGFTGTAVVLCKMFYASHCLPPRFELEHAHGHVSSSPHKVSENVLTPLNTVQRLAQMDVRRKAHECRVVFMWD